MYWLLFVNVLFYTFLTSETKFLSEVSKLKWLCANENCSEPISVGHSVKAYSGDDILKVNFNVKDKILIYGKPNGTENNYWLVQAGDKKGIAPVQFIKEDKIIVKKKDQVETMFNFSSILPPVSKKPAIETTIKPSPPPEIVVDGTTVPYDVEEMVPIKETGTESQNSDTGNKNPALEDEYLESLNENKNDDSVKTQETNQNAKKETKQKTDIVNGTEVDIGSNNKDDNNNNMENSDNIDPSISTNESLAIKLQETDIRNSSIKTSGDPIVLENYSNGTVFHSVPVDIKKATESTSSASIYDGIESDSQTLLGVSSPESLFSGNDLPVKEGVESEEYSVTDSKSVNMLNETFSNTIVIPSNDAQLNNESNGYLESAYDADLGVVTIEDDTDVIDIGNTKTVAPIVISTSSTPVSSFPNTNFNQETDKKYDNYTSESNVYNQSNRPNSDSNINQLPSSEISPEMEKLIDSDSPENDLTVEESITVPPPHMPRQESDQTNTVQDIQEENMPDIPLLDDNLEESDEGESRTNYLPDNDGIRLVDSMDQEAATNWFSGFSSVMNSFKEMFAVSDDKDFSIGTSKENVVNYERSSAVQEMSDEVVDCDKEPDDFQPKDYSQFIGRDDGKENSIFSEMFEGFSRPQMSFSTVVCLIITSVVVLFFSLGHYYLENLKQDTALIAKINTFSTELFFAQKELASIEEKYQEANESYQKLVSETSNNELAIEGMRKELEESKAARNLLEVEIKRLEKEIESLIEEGDEMHRMLSESFSEEERTKSLLTNIADLKSVLSERLQEIVSLTEQLDVEKQEVELLTISLKKSEEKREATEDKLVKVLNDADSKTLSATKEFEEKISTLERIIEERYLERTNFEKQICELKGACESLMVEKELVEKELKKAHGMSSGKALSDWLETKQIRTDLLAIQKESEKLKKDLEETKHQCALLEGREKELLNEFEVLNNKYESAEKDKIEALTKLQVLSNHFKEKEVQLQEELGTKEAQWLQKQSEDHSIYEQMRSLREENLSYKAQNDALKKEILDQETSFKIQIANEEQKAQDNWINLRHTERRLKEVQMEAAHLRSRLTALEANPDTLEEKHKSLEMVNGEVTMGAASPPFMLYPRDFIPPPPLVSPTRPPPLGRLSSPPLTPPAPLSPFEFFPPPPPSPPLPHRVHKPQPREQHRKQKDSQSSNHSSESTEKPTRRGKR